MPGGGLGKQGDRNEPCAKHGSAAGGLQGSI